MKAAEISGSLELTRREVTLLRSAARNQLFKRESRLGRELLSGEKTRDEAMRDDERVALVGIVEALDELYYSNLRKAFSQ